MNPEIYRSTGQHGFDIAYRGYQRQQVDACIGRLQAQLAAALQRAATASARASATASAAEHAPLAAAQADAQMRAAREHAAAVMANADASARSILAEAHREASHLVTQARQAQAAVQQSPGAQPEDAERVAAHVAMLSTQREQLLDEVQSLQDRVQWLVGEKRRAELALDPLQELLVDPAPRPHPLRIRSSADVREAFNLHRGD